MFLWGVKLKISMTKTNLLGDYYNVHAQVPGWVLPRELAYEPFVSVGLPLWTSSGTMFHYGPAQVYMQDDDDERSMTLMLTEAYGFKNG